MAGLTLQEITLIDALAQELEEARRTAAAAVDRAEAIAGLAEMALEVQEDGLGRPVELGDLIEGKDEERRAQARSLMERIVNRADELKGILGG
jgi:hypothetical protein